MWLLHHPRGPAVSKMFLAGRSTATWIAFLAFSACASDRTAVTSEEGVAVECYALWLGALPDYAGQSVTIRACLNESTCSDEHVLTAERGASRDYGSWHDGFHLVAHFYPEGDIYYPEGVYVGDEEINLGVSLFYSPEFAATLSEEDRATLFVSAEDGSSMMESVSAVPYLDDVRRDGEILCKSVYLGLDGTERPRPASDPQESPPSR
jgi:hypothetical protein